MSQPEPLRPVPLEQTRERVIAELCRGFAEERLEAEELQERLERAQHAATLDDLRALVADLPAPVAPGTPHPAAADATAVAYPVHAEAQQFVIAVMGGASRKGSWTPPRQLNVMAVMAGADLDFREATMGPGVYEINAFALMGGVQVVVPPHVRVEVTGIALMGGFDQRARPAEPPPPDAPVLRIGGFALMGGVDVTVRLPGESERDARQRHRELKTAHREQRKLDQRY
jgi:hypothetical protein